MKNRLMRYAAKRYVAKRYVAKRYVANVIVSGIIVLWAMDLGIAAQQPPSLAYSAGEQDETNTANRMIDSDQGVFELPAAGAGSGVAEDEILASPGHDAVWTHEHETAMADGAAIDAAGAWASWRLLGSGLTRYALDGDGVPEFEFSTFGLGTSGVVSAKGADRTVFMETNVDEDAFWLHGFSAGSGATPDWSFPFPDSVSGHAADVRRIAISHDGSTAAAVVRDTPNSEWQLYLFDADTGDAEVVWTDDSIINTVELTDDGAMALVTQQNRATVLDTETGVVLFQTPGSGGGSVHYRISGDGNVLVLGGFDLHVYRFDGDTWQLVIDFSPEYSAWFGFASVVSRDGSTVGTLTRTDSTWLNVEAFTFDVETGEMLGSHPFSGSGAFQGSPRAAASNDDGTVMAFASWGTEFQDWPEIMVFNREVELIGAIHFPGSGYAVDVSADGQYVIGGAKAIHANVEGSGGRVTLIEIEPGGNPIPLLSGLDPASVMAGSEAMTLVVSGNGFRETSVLRFDGADRPTTFVDTHTLTADIPATDLETAGLFPITVFNPEPAGGDSDPLMFEVAAAQPPTMEVHPAAFDVELESGQSTTETLTITNPGAETLEWSLAEDPGGHRNTLTLSHSEALDIQAGNTVACSPDKGVTTTGNQFLRTFELSEFDIVSDYAVTEVTFGVQTLNSPATIDVNLYTLDGDFIYDNLTLIGSASEALDAQDLSLVTVTVEGTVPAGSTLVVEIAAPDLSGTASFFAGSNDLGETAPSYLASDACEQFDPAPYAQLGFPDVHLVMSVTGDTAPADCTLPAWMTVDPSSGTVAPDSDQSIEVTFDGTSLPVGEYQANLCLASNDPDNALVLVPVSLVIGGEPADEVFADRFED